MIIYLIGFTLILLIILGIGFHHLPREKWQVLAAVPVYKNIDNTWTGIIFTWYGLISSISNVFAFIVFIVLTTSIGIPKNISTLYIFMLMLICFPFSKILASVFEKKENTLTIGGAVFVGALITPFIIYLFNNFIFKHNLYIYPKPFIAALIIAYAYGEGMGRLSCISFGCCYGKLVDDLKIGIKCKNILKNFSFIFYGTTKKISYSHGLEGRSVVPIQAITSVFYILSSGLGLYLFLNGNFTLSILITFGATQLWRFFSEFLRADHRGNGKVSIYQKLSILGLVYVSVISFFLPQPHYDIINMENVFFNLWDPLFLTQVQIMWILIFIFMGRSKVIRSRLMFFLNEGKI